MSANDQNAGSQDFTRRALIGAGAAVAAGVMTSGAPAFGENAYATQLERARAAYDPADPEVTIDFSGLRATLENGVTWLVEQIPAVVLKSSEINNFVKLLGFVTPEGLKKYISIPFTTQLVAGLTSARGFAASDVLNTVLALYKVGQQFDIFSFDGRAFTRTTDKVIVNGNVVFQYETFAPTERGKQRLDTALKGASSFPSTALNVSKLLAVPSSGLASNTFALENARERLIPQIIFDQFDVIHHTLVTDDGSNVPATALNVKRLLNYSAAERAAVTSGGAATNIVASGFKIDLNDVATIVQAATWILAIADEKGKVKAAAARVSGSIGISISF